MNRLFQYKEFLWEYNQKINLISRRMAKADLDLLLRESALVEGLIGSGTIVDVGSGNGLLGIPIALARSECRVDLVEPIGKKAAFLAAAKTRLSLGNLEVFHGPIDQYVRTPACLAGCAVSRGFPRPEIIGQWLKTGRFEEIIWVTSKEKAEKMYLGMEYCQKNIYNIPWRDQLVVFKATIVSRETKEK